MVYQSLLELSRTAEILLHIVIINLAFFIKMITLALEAQLIKIKGSFFGLSCWPSRSLIVLRLLEIHSVRNIFHELFYIHIYVYK